MNTRTSPKGSVLLTTLWITAILTLLAMGIGFRASLEVRLAKYNMDKLQARFLAKAGITKAAEYLSDDKNNSDTLYECGISLGTEETPEGVFNAELGGGDFSVHYTTAEEIEVEGEEGVTTTPKKYYGMMDEERKVNINVSKLIPEGVTDKRNEYRRILRRLFPEPAEGEFEKEDIINAMLDWQDADLAGDGEKRYYQGLEHPYECKNRDFDLIEEMLLVRGVTREFFDAIKDYITVYGEGKININTATRKVLTAIVKDPVIVDDLIFKHRQGADGVEGTEDDGKLTQIAFIPQEERQYFDFKSGHFRVSSYGNVRRVKSLITAVLKRDVKKDEGKFAYYHEE